MGFFIDSYRGFKGNVQELVDLSIQCTHFMNLSGDIEKINERTVRYYVTEGLVDKPLRIGRDAEYGYSHLVQFLASRYLVGEGYPIAKVAPYIASKSLEELEQFLMRPNKPNLAELLVASFAKEKGVRNTSEFLSSSFLNKGNIEKRVMPHLNKMTQKQEFGNPKGYFDHDCQEELERLRQELREMRRHLTMSFQALQNQYMEDRERWQRRFDELNELIKKQNK